MISEKSARLLSSAGALSAIAASLCCFAPIITLFAGSSMALKINWIEPVRPYLIGVALAALGLAWYRNLKPKFKSSCHCEVNTKDGFLQSKTFLTAVTLFAAFIIAFPYYANAIYVNNEKAALKYEGAPLEMKLSLNNGKSHCKKAIFQPNTGIKKGCCQRDELCSK